MIYAYDADIIAGILLALCCSIALLSIHIILHYFRQGRRMNEPLIFELKRQFRFLSAIWLFFFAAYAFLFFSPLLKNSVLLSRLSNISQALGFIYGAILYSCLAFLYLTVYYLIDRSVSATILEMIEKSPGKKISVREIKDMYDVEAKYRSELKGMLEGGFIILQGDSYRNSFKGRCYAAIAIFTKKLLKLGPGG